MLVSTVTIMGLSTEGYQIASTLASKKIQTFIIDENLQMGMELKPEIIRNAPTVHSFIEGEPLVGLQPMSKALSKAECIFFTPKIRRPNESSLTEILNRLRDVASDMSRKVNLVMTVPMGLGQNTEAISLIEKLSGLREGDDFHYVYAPLKPRSRNVYSLGLTSPKLGKEVSTIFDYAGIKVPQPLSLNSAEIYLYKQITTRYNDLTADLELYRRVKDASERSSLVKQSSYREKYLDDMVDNFLDLKMLSETLETGDPLLYHMTGSVKSVEGYIRRLIEEVRHIFKEKMLKASRTQVILAWSIDPYEIRGYRHILLGNILNRLRDYVGDVTAFRSQSSSEETIPITPALAPGKANFVIFCSDKDFNTCSPELRGKHLQLDQVLLKANVLFELVE